MIRRDAQHMCGTVSYSSFHAKQILQV